MIKEYVYIICAKHGYWPENSRTSIVLVLDREDHAKEIEQALDEAFHNLPFSTEAVKEVNIQKTAGHYSSLIEQYFSPDAYIKRVYDHVKFWTEKHPVMTFQSFHKATEG